MRFEPYGPVEKEKIEAFERDFSLRLPEDYKAFLLQTNGGAVDPNCEDEIDKDGACTYSIYLEEAQDYCTVEYFNPVEVMGGGFPAMGLGDVWKRNFRRIRYHW